LELRDKVADVTGRNRGIGSAVAWLLAKERVDVALVARDRAAFELPLRKSRENRSVKGWIAEPPMMPASRPRCSASSAALIFSSIAPPRWAAKAKPPMLAPKSPTRRFFADINVNVMGYLRTIREVAAQMAAQGGGRIINLSGLAALQTTIGTIPNSPRRPRTSLIANI
jgi:NAD(P)-dependent dehydrogenase (short-subunit alcohol dehydrogenase family)